MVEAGPGGADQRKEFSATTVTCTYTEARWPQLLAAVRSARTQTQTPDEVVVIVDYNEPLLLRARHYLPGVRVEPNTHSRGLSGARNTGTEVATSEIVAFLDDDARADPTWLEVLLQHFRDSRVAGVSGAAVPDWQGAPPRWLPHEFRWVVGCSYRGLPRAAAPVRNLMGTNMLIRRAVLADVEGFHEGFGMIVYGREGGTAESRGSTADETELCIRASNRRSHLVWMYDPQAIVHHLVTEERSTFRYFVSRCRVEGRGKAELAARTGASAALGSERKYLARDLPSGVIAELVGGAGRGDLDSLARIGAMIIGTVVAGSTYVAVRSIRRLESIVGLPAGGA